VTEVKRGIVGVVMVASLVAGCARSGVDGAAPGVSGHAGPPSARFAEGLATCVERSPQPPPAVVTQSTGQGSTGAQPQTSVPSLTAQELERLRRLNEELRRTYTPGQAFFRDRRPLAADVEAANQPCADEVVRGLTLMGAENRYDADSVKLVLDGAGLTGIVVRPAGQRDPAGSGGLLFAGWTGQVCVFGQDGPNHITAGVGNAVTGGGCLPD
jgi:hypothetical protein